MRFCNNSRNEKHSNYACRIMEYQSDVSAIRKVFGVQGKVEGNEILGCKQYDKYLGDNKEILIEMRKSLLSGENLLVSDTGSGKTRTLFSLTKTGEWNIGIFIYWSLTNQVSNIYDVKRLVGGDHADMECEKLVPIYDDEDIEIISDANDIQITSSKKMAVLMDVVIGLEHQMRNLQEQGVDFKKEHGIVWIDEAHLIMESSSYRTRAVKALMNFLKFIREETSIAIVYTTATPNTCALLPYQNLYFYDKREEASNIKEIYEYRCSKNEKMKDVILSVLRKEISHNHKVILRVNDKSLIENLSEQIDGFEIITGQDKDSVAYEDILKHSKVDFSKYNGLGLTCVLDSGISISNIEGCKIEDITNIFVIDKHFDIMDLKQFSNRLRFNTKLVLIVGNHTQKDVLDLKTFGQIIRSKGKIYGEAYNNYKALEASHLYVYKNKKAAVEELKRILGQKDYFGHRNDMGVFRVNEYTNGLEYDYFAAFNKVYEAYQRQYFQCNEMRNNVLKDIFLVDMIKPLDIEIIDAYTDMEALRADMFIRELSCDDELKKALEEKDYRKLKKKVLEQYGDKMKKPIRLLESKKFKQLQALMIYESVDEAISDVINLGKRKYWKKHDAWKSRGFAISHR